MPRILVTIGAFDLNCGGSACANRLALTGAPAGSDFEHEPPGGGPLETLGVLEVSGTTTSTFNDHTTHEFGHNLDMFLAAGWPEDLIMPFCKKAGTNCSATCTLGTEEEAPAVQETVAQLLAIWGIHALFDGIDASTCTVLDAVSLGTNKAPHNDDCRPNGEPFDQFTLAGMGPLVRTDGFPSGACAPSEGYRLDPLFQAFWEILNRQECTINAPFACADFQLPNPAGEEQADLARNAAAEAVFYALRKNAYSHEMLVDLMGAYYGCNFGADLYNDRWCDVFEHHGVFECDPLPTCQVCGNATLDPGEACDDGNGSNTDACTNACENAICGDDFVWEGVEECDDGNTNDGDGCSSSCTIEGGSGDDGGAEPCPEGDPGCPGGPCLLDPGDEARFQAFPGVAAYHDGENDSEIFGPFCNDPMFICREGPADVFTCHDCTAFDDSGWGCPCGEAPGAVTEACLEYTDMFCFADVSVGADPRQSPVAPQPGACFPIDDGPPPGFCTENCTAQDRVCGKLIGQTIQTVCVAPECFPPCETDGPSGEPVCDRDFVLDPNSPETPLEQMCEPSCEMNDALCPVGTFCTNWGECWPGSP